MRTFLTAMLVFLPLSLGSTVVHEVGEQQAEWWTGRSARHSTLLEPRDDEVCDLRWATEPGWSLHESPFGPTQAFSWTDGEAGVGHLVVDDLPAFLADERGLDLPDVRMAFLYVDLDEPLGWEAVRGISVFEDEPVGQGLVHLRHRSFRLDGRVEEIPEVRGYVPSPLEHDYHPDALLEAHLGRGERTGLVLVRDQRPPTRHAIVPAHPILVDQLRDVGWVDARAGGALDRVVEIWGQLSNLFVAAVALVTLMALRRGRRSTRMRAVEWGALVVSMLAFRHVLVAAYVGSSLLDGFAPFTAESRLAMALGLPYGAVVIPLALVGGGMCLVGMAQARRPLQTFVGAVVGTWLGACVWLGFPAPPF